MIQVAAGVGVFLLLAFVAAYFVLGEPTSTGPTVKMTAVQRPPLKEFTVAELAPYNGTNGSRIYIGCDGVVFDMSSHESGPSFYGPGGAYGIFAGKDATIGLATMQLDVSQWASKKASDLSAAEKDVVHDWVMRFRNKYTIVGVLADGARPSTLADLQARGLLS